MHPKSAQKLLAHIHGTYVYCVRMIRGFADKHTENLYHGRTTGKRLPWSADLCNAAQLKLCGPMIPENRIPTHPGEVLLAEFLEPWGLSQAEFARQVGIPLQRVNEIVKGKRGVTPEPAWILAQAFGTTPEFWMNLQVLHDLAKAKPSKKTPRGTRVA